MARPFKVQVGAFLYTVIYDKDEIRLLSADKGRTLAGHVDHHTLVITIDDTTDEQVIRDTLLHEVIHCLWNDAGIGGSDMNQEDIVGSLTPRWMVLLRDNPKMFEYLVRGYDEAAS